MMGRQRMKHVSQGRADVIHVETDLGIVNIYVGLRDTEGRRVERIEYRPNEYAGEPVVVMERNIVALRAVEMPTMEVGQ